jgi:pimeloyl-ACP methyl ester carboxylesterase
MDHLCGGHHLYYEVHGPQSGPAVILLHHGLGSVQAWKAQVPALTAAGCRVLVYDRWGYGKSDPRPRLSIPYFEEDLADLLSLVEILEQPRFTLIGHSDGGTLSLYFAAAHPERLQRLVSISAHIYIEAKMEKSITGVYQAFEKQPGFRAGLQRVHGDKTQALFKAWFDGWYNPANRSWDMRPILGQIACPVLIVQGMQDEHATPQQALDTADVIPDSELWLARGAAHMLPQDMPDAFNRRMLEFLSA